MDRLPTCATALIALTALTALMPPAGTHGALDAALRLEHSKRLEVGPCVCGGEHGKSKDEPVVQTAQNPLEFRHRGTPTHRVLQWVEITKRLEVLAC